MLGDPGLAQAFSGAEDAVAAAPALAALRLDPGRTVAREVALPYAAA